MERGRRPFVYILGAGHSGSTLLAMLLGAHPRICTLGEVKAPRLGAPAVYRCSCGEGIVTCGFWQSLRRAVEARGVQLDFASGATDIRQAPTPYLRLLMKPLHRSRTLERLRNAALSLSPAWAPHVARFQALNTALAEAACGMTGADVFVDSSKTGLQLKHLLRTTDLDVKVIRLVRDGRGVSLSYRTAEGLTFAEGAYAWRRSNEEAAAIVTALPPDRWFDLRYEALCRDVESTMGALFGFIGVERLPFLTRAGAGAQHVLGNNNARLKTDEVRLDERWRRTLTAEELAAFDRVAGSLNVQLGYAS
jgi:hypothetical protein